MIAFFNSILQIKVLENISKLMFSEKVPIFQNMWVFYFWNLWSFQKMLTLTSGKIIVENSKVNYWKRCHLLFSIGIVTGFNVDSFCFLVFTINRYHACCDLYTFYPILVDHLFVFKELFHKILSCILVSILEQFLIKSEL